MRFAEPTVFLLFVPLVIIVMWVSLRNTSDTLSFSSLSAITGAGKSLRQKLLWLPYGLLIAGMAMLILAIARPQKGVESVVTSEWGIAIAMLMDISSSMDIAIDSKEPQVSRISAAKKVFEDFVLGNGENLQGRPKDIIGMITFARYADTISPMTTSREALVEIVRALEVESRPDEDGTAYGDAIMLGAARLIREEEVIRNTSETSGNQPDLSKIIILLTDGENNCGKHLPQESAAFAKKYGIRIYAIFLGNETPGNVAGPEPTEDQKLLISICESSGGICRMVYDYDSLQSVYEEIDSLEKSELKVFTKIVYKEYFHVYGLFALLLLSLSMILESTVFRTAP